jgi:hypothetical protein
VVTLDQFSGTVPSQTKCDPEGNIYGSFAAGSSNSITRVSADGTQPTAFSLSAVPDLVAQNSSPPTIVEFAVGTDGSVYLLIRMRRQNSSTDVTPAEQRWDPRRWEYRVISFDPDGKYHSQFKLEEGLAPTRIAVFSSGDLMLAGSEPDPENERRSVPFAGVFDSSGRFMKEIWMPRDLRAPDGPQAEPSSNDGPRMHRFGLPTRGNAQGADDGNVYLLPNTSGTPVYVLSPGGEIVRTINLQSAANERVGMSAARGLLVSWSQHVDSRRFQRVASAAPPNQATTPGGGDSLFRIFNLQTGELAAEYSATAELGSFACYSSDRFTFMRLDQARHLQIVTASPH